MKVKSIVNSIEKKRFTSANDEIIVDTLSYSGPEMKLEDDSVILFSCMDAYFDVISDTNMYNSSTRELNLDELERKYLVLQDDVVGAKYKAAAVIEARTYSFPLPGYRLLF